MKSYARSVLVGFTEDVVGKLKSNVDFHCMWCVWRVRMASFSQFWWKRLWLSPKWSSNVYPSSAIWVTYLVQVEVQTRPLELGYDVLGLSSRSYRPFLQPVVHPINWSERFLGPVYRVCWHMGPRHGLWRLRICRHVERRNEDDWVSTCRNRIIYKLCVLMHLVQVGRNPAYLSDMMTSVADLPGRERLRSSSNFRYELPKLKLKFGERSFSFSGPKAWNSLPSDLQELTNTCMFKSVWKLTFLSSHSENLNDFVDAPLVTIGVTGVWNDVM